ncbi:MAG: DUF4867 family protein [Oscillospiraceae bacterium]|nr:DUF4867 family protein [Oscillospiraceae bacterium]
MMKLKLAKVTDRAFAPYGQVLEGYDFSTFLEALEKTALPDGRVAYVPSDPSLEADKAYADLRDRGFGGMPIQIGYCNGYNTALNALEYHRDSEICIAAHDCILLIALQSEIEQDGLLDTAKVKAFLLPAGVAVECFATTLHFAPCSAEKGEAFRVAVVLPLGTNTAKPDFEPKNREDNHLTAKNKWLLAHPDFAKDEKLIGLKGKNINLEGDLW